MNTAKLYIFSLLICFSIFLPLNVAQSNNGKPLRKVTLQLKWKHQFQFAGYYAAIEQGFYKEVGIEVTLNEAVEAQNPSDAVFNGKAEFGICGSDVLLIRAAGKPAVVLASVFQHSPLILLASKKSGVGHIQDLVGKKIAIEQEAADIIAYMNDEGVSLDKVIVKFHSFDVTKLISGEIDALSAYSTDELFDLREKNFPFSILSPLMGGIDFYGDVLFTNEKLIATDPELVENFRKASLKGWKYAMDNPGELTQLIYNKYSQRHTKEHLRDEAERLKNIIMRDVVEIGYTNHGRWESILNIYKNQKMIDASFTTKGLFYSEYLTPYTSLPWKLIVLFSIILTVFGSAAYHFYHISRKLKIESENRLIIQNELAASEKKFKTILDTSPDGIAISSLGGVIQFVTPKTISLWGYNSADEILNRNLLEFVHPDYHEKALYFMNEMINGNLTGAAEYLMMRKDNTLFYAEINADILRDALNNPIGILFIERDITERKRVQEEISSKNKQLEELNASKDKFFSIIAHDLQSPFTGFLGLTEIMAADATAFSASDMSRISSEIHNSANNLFKLLKNLLEWAQMQKGSMSFQAKEFLISNLIADTVEILKERSGQKGIAIINTITKPVQVYADDKMINSVVLNLISNAVKFTSRDGIVTITADTSNPDFVQISIRDSGIGIDKSKAEKLFTIGEGPRAIGTEGELSTGLGLLLCKEFVEKNGGSIRAESEIGKGSTFSFSLPAKNNS